MPIDSQKFIVSNTRLIAPPLVPEIELYLAEESLPIWHSTEEQLGEINVPPPYWAFAWAGGQALARYILDHAGLLRGKSVLDLGSGSGLTAIAAAHAGAAHVIASDVDALALAAIDLNADANSVRITTTADDLLASPPPPMDVLLVGDLFYERELAGRTQGFIDSAKVKGTLILIGDPQRNYFPKGRFTELAVYQVPVTRELEDATIKRTAVWRA